MAAEPSQRVVLLVEDNPADADLVRDILEEAEGDRYRFRVVHAGRLSDAIDLLGRRDVDVILLDLGLPDSSGTEALAAIQEFAGRVPIVVLTGRDDQALGMRCIDLGAQDYLSKSEMRATPVRRSIGYAIARSHEAEIRDLREALDHYREISSRRAQAAPVGVNGAFRERVPAAFGELVDAYRSLLRRHVERLVVRTDKPRDDMGRIIARLGDHGAGPRDLIDIHVSALSQSVEDGNTLQARTLAVEGRLLALEMMGLLADFYRVRNAVELR